MNVNRLPTLTIIFLFLGLVADATAGDAKRVVVSKTPAGGIQPQAVMDAKGTLHLIYFQGDAAAGDLYYVRRPAREDRYSIPLRVNSERGSAIAVGAIRGGQLALGKDGRVHVAWNGSGQAAPKGPGRGTPMLYARLNDRGAAFEPQRNLMSSTEFLDGGGTVSADDRGNVYVAWHAKAIDGPAGEEHRRVWLAVSRDDGKTFAREAAAFDKDTGACGCCGMRAFTDPKGNTYFLYRAASAAVHRDMWLLASADQGKSFQGTVAHKWKIDSCPMSSEAFAEAGGAVYGAWETDGQVYFARLQSGSAALRQPLAAPGEAKNRKHPALAVNAKGEVMLIWTEGTGWNRGGSLAWQVYDANGRPTRDRGRVHGGIPVWGLAAVVARADGSFEIIY